MRAFFALLVVALAADVPRELADVPRELLSCACPAVHDPVCTPSGKQHSHACYARCAGDHIFTAGPCPSRPTCICTGEYKPVCANGRTYSNKCQAECAGVPFWQIRNGACGGGNTCICTREYKPVCGSNGKTYSNACEAGCARVRVIYNGKCQSRPPCSCLAVYDPVCVNGKTYSSRCQALCAGAPSWQIKNGACSSNACEYKCRLFQKNEVCGANGVTYRNQCAAKCARVYNWTHGKCGQKQWVCLTACFAFTKFVWNPICVGGQTFFSPCHALCFGITQQPTLPYATAVAQKQCSPLPNYLGRDVMTCYANKMRSNTGCKTPQPLCGGSNTFANKCHFDCYPQQTTYTNGNCQKGCTNAYGLCTNTVSTSSVGLSIGGGLSFLGFGGYGGAGVGGGVIGGGAINVGTVKNILSTIR